MNGANVKQRIDGARRIGLCAPEGQRFLVSRQRLCWFGGLEIEIPQLIKNGGVQGGIVSPFGLLQRFLQVRFGFFRLTGDQIERAQIEQNARSALGIGGGAPERQCFLESGNPCGEGLLRFINLAQPLQHPGFQFHVNGGFGILTRRCQGGEGLVKVPLQRIQFADIAQNIPFLPSIPQAAPTGGGAFISVEGGGIISCALVEIALFAQNLGGQPLLIAPLGRGQRQVERV